MGFSIQVEGLNELLKDMENMPKAAEKVAAEALYEGAGVMADAVSKAVDSIETEPFRYAAGGKKRKPSPEEKAILQAAPKGVAKFRKNGVGIQTSVGMQNSGYATLEGKNKPVPQIANSINSGTSFMEKQPFMRRAFSQNQSAAQAAIEAGIRNRENELQTN